MSLLSFFTDDDEQKRADELNAKLRALNEADYAPGGRLYNKIAEQQGPAAAIVAFQQVEEHLDTEDEQSRNLEGQVSAAFGESISENTKTIREGVGSAVNSVFSLIPWQVWILAAVALFVYMGGWLWLKGRLLR